MTVTHRVMDVFSVLTHLFTPKTASRSEGEAASRPDAMTQYSLSPSSVEQHEGQRLDTAFTNATGEFSFI